MDIEILHFVHASEIPSDTRRKMVDLVANVYNADNAAEFATEMERGFPYEYTIFQNKSDSAVIALGCIMTSGLDFDIWEFAWAMVDEKYRGQYLGKRLNAERIAKVREYGGKKILVVTKKPWHVERNGFHIIHTFADGDNLMVCEL